MNETLKKIRELTEQKNAIEQELSIYRNSVLEEFRNMSAEDVALYENRIGGEGIVVQYYPQSTTKSVDTARMKKDGIYEQYVKVSKKSDYIKVLISNENN